MPNILQTKAALWAICLKRAGYRDGALLIEFIDDWRACVEVHDGPVGIEAYAAWSRRLSTRTAYRRLALFRKTFPQLGPDGTPEGIMGPLLERLAAEDEAET
jgi:hypothetical protein